MKPALATRVMRESAERLVRIAREMQPPGLGADLIGAAVALAAFSRLVDEEERAQVFDTMQEHSAQLVEYGLAEPERVAADPPEPPSAVEPVTLAGGQYSAAGPSWLRHVEPIECDNDPRQGPTGCCRSCGVKVGFDHVDSCPVLKGKGRG